MGLDPLTPELDTSLWKMQPENMGLPNTYLEEELIIPMKII